ncbi:uncharacterized protein LOC144763932 isoform X1 [Lissotriton helveticus]
MENRQKTGPYALNTSHDLSFSCEVTLISRHFLRGNHWCSTIRQFVLPLLLFALITRVSTFNVLQISAATAPWRSLRGRQGSVSHPHPEKGQKSIQKAVIFSNLSCITTT